MIYLILFLSLFSSLFCFGNGIDIEEWNVHNLDIHDWEISFPSPYPTPFEQHPRNSASPTISAKPTGKPTGIPTSIPTPKPSEIPSGFPTSYPTQFPTKMPSSRPTIHQSDSPSITPTSSPPSTSPTPKPSPYPTLFPSLPGHIGSQPPTPSPTTTSQALQLQYILFGAVVTLADMMVIAATIWSAVILMIVAFINRRNLFGDKDSNLIPLDTDSSTHTDISDHSITQPFDPSSSSQFHMGVVSQKSQQFPTSSFSSISSLSQVDKETKNTSTQKSVTSQYQSNVFRSTTTSTAPSLTSLSLTPDSLSRQISSTPQFDDDDSSTSLK